jgi:hypothetical protein
VHDSSEISGFARTPKGTGGVSAIGGHVRRRFGARSSHAREPTAEITLPCDFLSPRVARRFVTETLHQNQPAALVDAAELLVSEVVTRIVVLGCTGVVLAIDDGPAITITVTYVATSHADLDRVPGPVAPKLAVRSTRIDLDERTIRHVFVLDEGSAGAAG